MAYVWRYSMYVLNGPTRFLHEGMSDAPFGLIDAHAYQWHDGSADVDNGGMGFWSEFDQDEDDGGYDQFTAGVLKFTKRVEEEEVRTLLSRIGPVLQLVACHGAGLSLTEIFGAAKNAISKERACYTYRGRRHYRPLHFFEWYSERGLEHKNLRVIHT